MENITVYAKLETTNEKKEKSNFIYESKKITNKKTKEIFNFDSIINQSLKNKDIFTKIIKNNLSLLLEGINISIILYGKNNKDKTFLFNGLNNTNEGLIQLSIKEIFNLLNNKYYLVKNYEIKISYIEINNEEINDLIDISKKNLEIKNIPNRGIIIDNISEINILNDSQIVEIFNNLEINKNNKIFKIGLKYCIEDKNKKNKEKKCFSSLNFFDLSINANLNKKKEKENNNKSLLALTNVINTFNRSNNNYSMNIKENKLTKLLNKSFDINSKIIIICSIIDDNNNFSETLNILNIAKKLKNIKISNKNNKINDKGKPIMEKKN